MRPTFPQTETKEEQIEKLEKEKWELIAKLVIRIIDADKEITAHKQIKMEFGDKKN